MDIYDRSKRSQVMSRVRSANTQPELIVRKKLHSLGFRYRLHCRELPGTPDIVLPKYRAVVFVHGCFWHHHASCSKSKLPSSNVTFWNTKIVGNVDRDKRNIRQLRSDGWRTLVLWECDVESGKYQRKLERFLGRMVDANQ